MDNSVYVGLVSGVIISLIIAVVVIQYWVREVTRVATQAEAAAAVSQKADQLAEQAIDKAAVIAAGHRDLLNRVDEIEKYARITELERRLSLIGDAIPLATAFQASLIKELTHYHTPRMDELMTKIGPPSTLTGVEEAELWVLLAQRTHDMGQEISDSERDAAVILPFVMRRAKLELETIATLPVRFKLVSVSIAADEGEG
jgi:hypothetical protein